MRPRLPLLLTTCALVVIMTVACKRETSTTTTTTGASAAAPAAGWVAIAKGGGSVASLVKAEVARAEAAGKKPVVYLGASWCGPCKSIKKYKSDTQMVTAFEGTYIIELDVDDWRAPELGALGYKLGVVPVFIAVDKDGKAKGPTIDGGAWGDNIPANMAPPLGKFFASI